jgi:hypothetical protein
MERAKPPRSSTLRWLDAPALPPEAVLTDLRSALAANPGVVEASLVRQLVASTGQEPREQLSIALYSENGAEPREGVAEILASLMQRPPLEPLGIGSAIIVNDGIRAKVEREGLRIYARPSR